MLDAKAAPDRDAAKVLDELASLISTQRGVRSAEAGAGAGAGKNRRLIEPNPGNRQSGASSEKPAVIEPFQPRPKPKRLLSWA